MLFSHEVMCDSFVTLWTIAHQAPLSTDFPGKKTGVGCQGIVPTQQSTLCPLLGRCILHR